MASFFYAIIVDANDNAQVFRIPDFSVLKKDQDDVTFLSNDTRTVIQYQATSPFTGQNHPKPQIPFAVGRAAKGPYTVRVPDTPSPGHPRTHHFDCGFLNPAASNLFAPWGGTQGDDTPVDP